MKMETTYGTSFLPTTDKSKTSMNSHSMKGEPSKEKPGVDYALLFVVLLFLITALLYLIF
jgi:hypothetical protein